MAGVEISADGRTATVDGTLVAIESLPRAQQDQLRAMARDPMNPQDGGMPVVSGFGGVPSSQGTGNVVAPRWAVPPSAPSTAPPPKLQKPVLRQSTPTPTAPARPAAGRQRFATLVNRSTQTQGIVDADKHLDAQAKLAERERDMAWDKAEYRAEVAEAEAQAAGAEVAARERAMADLQRVRQDGDAQAATHMQQAEAKRAEASELQKQGHDFWEDKGVGQRIMAVIGLAAGGALSGMNGGPNQAMAQLNRMMAREDDLHQRKIAGLRKDAEGEISFYNIAKAATSDEVAQRLMVQNMQLDTVKAKTRETQAQLDSEAGASLALDELTMAIDQRQAANAQALAERFSTTTKARTVPVGPTSAVGSDGVPANKAIPGLTIDNPEVFNALPDTDRRAARATIQAGLSGSALLDKMISLRTEHGSEAGGTEAQAEFASHAAGYLAELAVLNKQGVMSDAEYSRNLELMGGGLEPGMSDISRVWGNDELLNRLKGSKKTLEAKTNAQARTYGGHLEGTDAASKRIKGAGSW